MAELASPPALASGRREKRRQRRRHLKVTREGRLFLLVTVGVGFAALNTGNNLMYLAMAFMLSLIVLSGILSELAIKGLEVSRTLPARAFAGEPMLIQLSVNNGKPRVPSYSIELRDEVAGEGGGRRCYLLKVEAARERKVIYRRTPTERGELCFERYRIGTRYPFSLFYKWRIQEDKQSLLVYPRREHWKLASAEGSGEGDRGGRAAGRGVETRELREYRVGDEMRRIHWRRSAAVGRFVVRENEDETSRLFSLVIDNARPSDDEAFTPRLEHAIARAAYAAEHWAAQGASVEVVVRGGRSPLVGPGERPDPVWAFLARLSSVPADAAPPLSASRPRAERIMLDAEPGEP